MDSQIVFPRQFKNNNMHNPVARPQTLPQWLLCSMCWTAGCYGIYWLVARHYTLADGVEITAFWLAHILVWWRAVAGAEKFLRSPIARTTALEALGCLWYALLWVFQVIVLLMGAVTTLLVLASEGNGGFN